MLPLLISVLTIESVEVQGNRFFKTSQILNTAKLSKGQVFSKLKLNAAILKIRHLYFSKGFFNVSIDYDFDVDELGRVSIELKIDEGIRTRIANFSFEVDTLIPQVKLLVRTTRFVGVFYDEDIVNAFETQLYYIYYNNGFPFVRITKDTSFINDTLLGLKFSIKAGRKVYIKRIEFFGNRNVHSRILRREVVLEEGEPFNYSKIMESIKRLYSLRLFESVSYRLSEDGTLTFELEESKQRYLEGNVGFTYPNYLRLQILLGHMNIFGNLQNLEISPYILISYTDGKFSFFERSISMNYRERYFLDLRKWRMRSNLFYRRMDVLEEYGLTSEIVREFSSYFFTTFGLSFKSSQLLSQQPSDRIFILYEQFSYDDRDNIIDATRGFSLNLSLNHAFGNARFNKLIFSWSIYRSFTWFLIYAFRIRFGTILPEGNVPVSEKFLLGGEGSVRGYDLNSLGETVEGYIYKVSNNFMNFNVEFRFKPNGLLGYVIFLDGGSARDNTEKLLERIHVGYGVGLRIYLGFAPLRFDFAVPTDVKVFPRDMRIYFGIGNMF